MARKKYDQKRIRPGATKTVRGKRYKLGRTSRWERDYIKVPLKESAYFSGPTISYEKYRRRMRLKAYAKGAAITAGFITLAILSTRKVTVRAKSSFRQGIRRVNPGVRKRYMKLSSVYEAHKRHGTVNTPEAKRTREALGRVRKRVQKELGLL